MKKLIAVALLVSSLSTFAQVEKKEKGDKEPMEKMSPEKRSEREVKRMTKDLGLNDSQQKEMKALFSETASKRGEGDNKPSKENRKAMKGKISKILTQEQNAKWEKIQEERKEKMEERREGKGEKNEKSEDK